MSPHNRLDVKHLQVEWLYLKYLDIKRLSRYDLFQSQGAPERQVANVMWTNEAFDILTGQHDAVTTAAFEPARRREVLLGTLADTHCLEVAATDGQTHGRFGLASAALHALTGGRRFARG